jgi:cytoskeletal protein RodZ
MAIYTDPKTGERREVDDLVRPTAYGSSSWGVIAVLIIAAALAAWFFYGRATPTVDTTNTSPITQPAPSDTTPPTPSATTPAPSPSTTTPAPSDNGSPTPAPTTP